MTTEKTTFSRYQIFVIAVLAFLQFTVVLDFMILSPLGAILLDKLAIQPKQFGLVVSAYAFSAGISGILSAGFADRFDRKRLLLFFYAGFVVGTLLCGLATSYEFLLGARIFTGIFGGVIGSISFAIASDLFPFSMRGRVMGLMQTSFAATQILGIPIGLYLATKLSWHAPFLMIVAISIPAGIAIAIKMDPVDAHLSAARANSAISHLVKTASRPRYLAGFIATMLLATGGFMLMPFGSTFLVQNVGVDIGRLPLLYMITGFAAIFAGPLLGRASDTIGKFVTFACGTALTMATVLWYTNIGPSSFAFVVTLNVLVYIGISARMVSTMALTSALPDLADRGAYMAISSSLQQLSGGIAAGCAGLIVYQATPTSPLEHYPTLGFVVTTTMVITIALMWNVNRLVMKASPTPSPVVASPPAE